MRTLHRFINGDSGAEIVGGYDQLLHVSRRRSCLRGS
jgi:hypothetical protein